VRNESAGNTQGNAIISRRARRCVGAIGAMAAVALALTVAAPASASLTATATLAPIGTGSYVLTVTNTSPETITDFVVDSGEESPATNVVPSPACGVSTVPFGPGSILCKIAIAPGASGAMCYTGHALLPLFPGESVLVESAGTKGHIAFSTSPAVGSCPLPGFKGGSSGTGGASKCVVPNLKGKTLTAAEKAITQAHCAVGKVKKGKSSHVKKGHVISQSVAAGKALSRGAKVSLVVSKGH
jgi:PASTA domain